MKICQYAFGGHSKDGEAGASGEGDPQTNAFTGEGIKPWALKVRVGLNCAGLLKIQQKHLFFFLFFLPPECFRCLRLDVWKKHSRLFHWSCLWTFLTSIEVQIFVSSRRIYLTVSQRCLEKAREPQSIRIPEKSPDVRFLTKSGHWGENIPYILPDIFYPRYNPQHGGRFNTNPTSAPAPISHFSFAEGPCYSAMLWGGKLNEPPSLGD